MLVLTRKTQQQIQIGPHIKITILRVKGQAVRIGIEAPHDVSVLRTELADRLLAESEADAVEATSEKQFRLTSLAPAAAAEHATFTRTTADDKTNTLKRILRCRASRIVPAPERSLPESTGPASLAACLTATTSMTEPVLTHTS